MRNGAELLRLIGGEAEWGGSLLWRPGVPAASWHHKGTLKVTSQPSFNSPRGSESGVSFSNVEGLVSQDAGEKV